MKFGGSAGGIFSVCFLSFLRAGFLSLICGQTWKRNKPCRLSVWLQSQL